MIKESLIKASISALLTFIIYQFYNVEFIRATIEDAAFDTTSWFALSKTSTDTNQSNVFILMLDDKYLNSKKLLDDNNETNYGYILPREYLAEIISNLDLLVEDIDEENYPSALFLDYDLSYLSDPHNKTASAGDIELLEVLKHPRPYIIYLPITSNYNYIYYSADKEIQKLIDIGKIKFISVGLTSASDNVSRRYYPYELYRDRENKEQKFMNVAIELYVDQNHLKKNIFDTFSQTGSALVENRIIFKDFNVLEDTNDYTTYQSNWKKLSAMSANYPLDTIYEDDLKNAVFFVGAAHSASDDTFEIDAYSRQVSGIEMHANALMTLNYLQGKLKRLPLYISSLIVFFVILFVDLMLSLLYEKLMQLKESIQSQKVKKCMTFFIHDEKDDFHEMWLVVISLGIMFLISYNLLLSTQHYWFNWMIPALMYPPYLVLMGFKKFIK
ncbi:CHASE2 domain-containing protein [Sulfurimonas microaerophilic]|uniref:CHASE2 domain-containing protein n=1 Tax=Sulfurimonas microaerophilic TaxID=3058392 RepID=UPI0027150763|nr:CHASE2 domain-containing protein [Sulfurimonas sp. hsl 1-7]